MKEISLNILGNYWTTYEIVELLRQYISNQDNVAYRSLFEQVILDVRQSLSNTLDEE
jgi:hypothetical protein